MLRIILTSWVVVTCATTAAAQQWAEKMFVQRSHDFGAVPRAAKIEYQFTLTNLYRDDVHIASVRSSCGCTEPRIEKDTLKSHEQGSVVCQFNTNAFSGQHGARVTVTIDRPQYAEVQLDVKGYIRTDVVVDPSQVNFGSIGEGETAHKKIRINYSGRNDWKITDVAAHESYLNAAVREVTRSHGQVAYELLVDLKEGAPTGYLKDQLLLTTNDQRATQFPVNVEGLIVSELSVSPKSLLLGNLQPGQKVTKQIVVKGAKPFKIVDIRCENQCFSFQPSAEAKTVHLIPVTFEAGAKVGKISDKIEILTDLNDKSAELSAAGQVNEPLAGK